MAPTNLALSAGSHALRLVACAPLALAGCATSPVAGLHCLADREPYEWQSLDADAAIVWTLPTLTAYRIAFEEPLTELGGAQGAQLDLIDGNRDGLICDQGWDSAGAFADDAMVDAATIAFVDRVDSHAVAALRSNHRQTLSPRQRLDDDL